MKELFEKGNELQNKLRNLNSFVQNEGMKYSQSDIDAFNLVANGIMHDIDIWRIEVLLHAERNRMEEK